MYASDENNHVFMMPSVNENNLLMTVSETDKNNISSEMSVAGVTTAGNNLSVTTSDKNISHERLVTDENNLSLSENNLSTPVSATEQHNIESEMSVTDVICDINHSLEMSVEDVDDDDVPLEMSVEDVTDDHNLSLAIPASSKNLSLASTDENNPPKILKNFKYTIADYRSLLQKSYSTEKGVPFKNGYVMYILEKENFNISKAFKYLMEVAAQKNYPYARSIRLKIKRLHKSVTYLKKKLEANWPKLESLLEGDFEIREPVMRYSRVPPLVALMSSVEPNTAAETEIKPESESNKKPQIPKCIKCERLKKSLREIKKSLQDKIRNSKQLIRLSRNVKVKVINQALKRKVLIIKKVKAERFDLRRQNFLLEKEINRLSEKLQSKQSRLALKIPLCPRRHGEELQEEVRNKKAQIKKMESLVEKLQCQLRTVQDL